MPTATARLSSTTGDGCTPRERARRAPRSAASRCRRPSAPRRAARRSRPAAGRARARRRRSARSSARVPSSIRARVPARAVLVGERDVAAGGVGARRAARVVEQHEREQAGGLGVVGHELRASSRPRRIASSHRSARTRRVARRGGVALVEDEVDDGEHAGEAVGQLVVGRHAVGDAGVGDLALGAHEALGHRRLGDEERARDLGRRQAAERAQGQRHARLDGERRVAAGEDQAQPVVGDGASASSGSGSAPSLEVHERSQRRRLRRASARSRRMRSIARRARGDGQPGAGFAGHAVAGPRPQRRGERVLQRVLGELEVAASGG